MWSTGIPWRTAPPSTTQKDRTKVAAPAILVHADWRVTDAGILEGAMTDDDASAACAALHDCQLERVHTGHGFHDEDPKLFISLIHRLADRQASTANPVNPAGQAAVP